MVSGCVGSEREAALRAILPGQYHLQDASSPKFTTTSQMQDLVPRDFYSGARRCFTSPKGINGQLELSQQGRGRLPCCPGPSPLHACPGQGSMAGRPPSACPTSEFDSCLWGRYTVTTWTAASSPGVLGRGPGALKAPSGWGRADREGGALRGPGENKGPLHPQPPDR